MSSPSHQVECAEIPERFRQVRTRPHHARNRPRCSESPHSGGQSDEPFRHNCYPRGPRRHVPRTCPGRRYRSAQLRGSRHSPTCGPRIRRTRRFTSPAQLAGMGQAWPCFDDSRTVDRKTLSESCHSKPQPIRYATVFASTPSGVGILSKFWVRS